VSDERPIRVLVADDSRDNQMILRALLRLPQFDLVLVADGQAAVDAFFGSAFEVVLMDMEMPVLDGFEATRRIREREAQEGRSRVPILALTAHDQAEQIARTAAAGCDGHVTKPISRATLHEAITRVARP
jgi:CheY-like chemotaxis protein